MNKLKGALFMMALVSTIGMAETIDAVPSAIKWLEVVDSGEYVESWNKSAPYFQTNITSDKWVKALKKVREPLGNLITREVKTTSSHKTLPGLPDGEYTVIVFSTNYQHKNAATETVTVNKVNDDWRTVGYLIK